MNSSSPSPSSPESIAPPTSRGASAGGGETERVESAKRKVSEVASNLKSTATKAASQLKDEFAGMAQSTRTTAADRIGGYSSAAHDAAKSLESDDPNIAHFTHAAADRIQSVAEYVRSTELADLRRDVEGLARRHPVVFLGGMFVAGLVVGNLLKARPPGASSSSETDYDDAASAAGDEPSYDAPYANYAPSETASPFASTADDPDRENSI